MDTGFEKLKQEIEAELDRPIEQGEEITMKALYCFGKGLKLKNQLDSEPERLGDICKRVLEDIRGRMEQHQRKQHQARVIEATKDFISGKLGRNKKPERGSKVKTEKTLW